LDRIYFAPFGQEPRVQIGKKKVSDRFCSIFCSLFTASTSVDPGLGRVSRAWEIVSIALIRRFELWAISAEHRVLKSVYWWRDTFFSGRYCAHAGDPTNRLMPGFPITAS
jgi:hypothetical protein